MSRPKGFGMTSSEPSHSHSLDLELLEADASPIFVIKTSPKALDFELLFCNEAFRQGHFRQSLLGPNRAALLFRSWAQALGDFRPQQEFANRVWLAKLAGRDNAWKVVRAKRIISTEQDSLKDNALGRGSDYKATPAAPNPFHKRSKEEIVEELKRDRAEAR